MFAPTLKPSTSHSAFSKQPLPFWTIHPTDTTTLLGS